MANILETLVNGLTDEIFEQGDRNRLERLREYFKTIKPESLPQDETIKRLADLSKQFDSEHKLRARARYYYFLIGYAPEHMDLQFQEFVKQNIGETGNLLYQNRNIQRQEFAEALVKDINFVDKNQDSESPENKDKAARYLASSLEFAMISGLNEINRFLGDNYRDLFNHWMEADYY